ncbi:MAG: SDR family NAD(P)-dependent oxidoreductase [Maricaulaceae bacterium]
MSAKICLLTGATSGIGQAAALDLASKGYELFLTARSETKADATSALIKRAVSDAKITWLYGDLSRQIDVRRIAAEFLQSGKQIDVLFLNAGISYNKRILSEDGYEMMMAVNHLAPFLLTQLLFDRLCAGDHPLRVVATASGAYNFVNEINLDDISQSQNFKTFPAYGNSKLANILFIQSLAEKLAAAAPHKTLSVNCYHPGFVGTSIGTQVLLGKILMAGFKPFVRSAAKGAETGLFLALDSSVEGQNGGYYYNCKEQTLKPYARDAAAAEKLWAKSLEMTLG